MKDIINSLTWRYAVKKFDSSKKVSEENLNKILEAFRLTPSSFNLQAWWIVVVENQELKDKLFQYSYYQEQVKDCSHLLVLCRKTDLSEKLIDDLIDDLVKKSWMDKSNFSWYENMMRWFISKMSKEQKISWAEKQVYIALGNLLDVCACLEVDSCPMEWFDKQKYDEILNLKEKWLSSVLVLPIGYRAKDDKYATIPKYRYDLDDLVVKI